MINRPGNRLIGNISAIRILPLILVCVLVLMVSGCIEQSGPKPDSGEKPDRLPPDFITAPQLEIAAAGMVEVRVAAGAMATRFMVQPKGKGLERLILSDKAARLIRELDVGSVRRVSPWLEVTEKNRTRVLTDAEYRKKAGKKPRSRRAAEAMDGIERDMIMIFSPKQHPECICERLLVLPEIEQCKARYSRSSLAPEIPDDPDFVNQWGLDNPAAESPDQAPNFDIDAPEAWEIQKASADIVVAVVDTGVDICHLDLYEKIWINTNELPGEFVDNANSLSADPWPDILTFTDLDSSAPDMVNLRASWNLTDSNGNGRIDGEDLVNAFADGADGFAIEQTVDVGGLADDIVGWNFREGGPLPFASASESDHGTSVAGLVGAMTDNGLDTAGVGWNVRILPIRGDWSWPSIQYAIDRGCDVITSSLAANDSPELSAVVEDLDNEGIVFLASLGNVDRYIDGTAYAALPEVIAVSNFRSTGIRAFPKDSAYSVNTDVAGPGEGIYSTDWGQGTCWFGGTSGANPIVAGIVALLKAERGDLSPEQYRQVLLKSAADIPPVNGDQGENTGGFDYYSGMGLANAFNALSIIHDDPWAAANLVTPGITFYLNRRKENMHVIDDTIDIIAYAGLPGGGNADVTLEWAPGTPPVATDWTTVFSGSLPYVDKDVISTLTRADLPNGIVTTRLTVETGGKSFVGYGRIDVPRAYLDVKDNSLFAYDTQVAGFAFHPDFDHYTIEVAAGHNPVENDPLAWTIIGEPNPQEKSPSFSLPQLLSKVLMNPLPIADLPDGEATLRTAVYDAGDNRLASFPVPILVDKTTFPYQDGYPAYMAWPYRFGSAVAYDLTGDGQLELIVTNQIEVHVYRADGTELGGAWPANVGSYAIGSSPAVGDINGDGLPEVVVRANNYPEPHVDRLFVFDHHGHPVSPWEPVDPGTVNPWMVYMTPYDNPPVLADLDADGDLEILLSGVSDDPAIGAAVLAFQGNGDLWTTYDLGPTNAYGPPAVGDMDHDGQLDLAVLGQNQESENRLLLYRADGSVLAPALPVVSNPKGVSLADLNGDGYLEAVAIASSCRPYAVRYDGSIVPGWENPVISGCWTGNKTITKPVFGNLIGSAIPEVIFAFAEPTEDDYQYSFYAFEGTAAPVTGLEVDLQTDPLKVDKPLITKTDRDGDGIEDRWEKARFPGTDPARLDPSADPDRDGLSNFTEFKLNTNPKMFDSDGDSVNDGTRASWTDPRPGSRGRHPVPAYKPKVQPERSTPFLWIFLLIILSLVAVILVGAMK